MKWVAQAVLAQNGQLSQLSSRRQTWPVDPLYMASESPWLFDTWQAPFSILPDKENKGRSIVRSISSFDCHKKERPITTSTKSVPMYYLCQINLLNAKGILAANKPS